MSKMEDWRKSKRANLRFGREVSRAVRDSGQARKAGIVIKPNHTELTLHIKGYTNRGELCFSESRRATSKREFNKLIDEKVEEFAATDLELRRHIS